jgi:Hg(II)-responsive transcriptional regulator
METLRIGEVAGRAGVNVQTVRFYERRGLLPEPPRRACGYREYAPESVRRVRFIKRAQELGFTLAEVEELLRLGEDSRIPCREVRATTEMKIADIEEKMRRLRAMRAALAALIESCVANREHHCPLLEALDEAPVRSRARGAESSDRKRRNHDNANA